TLSGPGKYAGEQAERGILLAIQEQNAKAESKDERKLSVRHVDAHGKLEGFEGGAVRLVTVDKVLALMGGTTAEEVLRLDRVNAPEEPGRPERRRAPVLTPLGWKTAGMSELVFCLGLSPAYQGQVLARFIAEKWTPERLTMLVDERREDAGMIAD